LFDDFNICPYTGLRSFTEEESIYFKGRDEHIQEATKLLEKNKFLMLTGASGDGKSSLVYAGIIPNARSGFLKSKYSSWTVADFRPERTPLRNLCESLAKGLGIENADTVESELQHGFSALIDLYKSSKRFVDKDSVQWHSSNEEQKAALQREASNLIILADQFEEFFTNPENYQNGAPSTESALVLNVLLETARIALEEGYPIYVVFTMRSDYIGQCAAFRGLPEYIGFSQFFVPRMNRRQLLEVIEEPSVLSGNSISRRLTERLIEDITDGTDQLPMLQHALNQIWKMANSGKDEMDLIHYAMVGGMSPGELPDEDRVKFTEWFDGLPEKIRVCYDEASLQNVLNTHANILRNHASGYVKSHSGKSIEDEDAKLIIKRTFQCLTKINEGRAVRNRMTLDEITRIINKPEIDNRKVNLVLNAYRDSTNTLLKPFIGEENEGLDLAGSAVLDITHESLIRNWAQLNEWANEELEDYTIFLDFEQQLHRWLENDRSGDFLLSIGPLTYFEEWFRRKEPNKYWIARYEADDASSDKVNDQAEIILRDAREFLKSSARKHLITRTVMKYGPKRIAAVVTIVAVLLFSSFSLKNYLDRRDSAMLEFFKTESLRYGNSDEIFLLNSSVALYEQIRLEILDADEIVAAMHDTETKINMANALTMQFLLQGFSGDEPNMLRFVTLADSLLTVEMAKPIDERDNVMIIRETNDLMASALVANFYSGTKRDYNQYVQSSAKRCAQLAIDIISGKIRNFGDVYELNDMLEYALNEKAFTEEQIQEIISIISPLEPTYRKSWVEEYYPMAQINTLSHLNFGLNFNGLYQELGGFYAALGNMDKVEMVLDTLLHYNSNYPNESYLINIDNGMNIGDYLQRYGHDDKYDDFVKFYAGKENISEVQYYQHMIARSWYMFPTFQKLSLEGAFLANRHHNANLDIVGINKIRALYTKYREVLRESNLSTDQLNFYLALSYKDEGIKIEKFKERDPSLTVNVDPLFAESLKYYKLVDPGFLNEEVQTIPMLANFNSTAIRKNIYLYPDVRDIVRYMPGQVTFMNYKNSSFLEYILDQDHFSSLYEPQSLTLITEWLSEYEAILNGSFDKTTMLELTLLKELALQLTTNYGEQTSRFSYLFLMIGNEEGAQGDLKSASMYYANVKMDVIFNFLGTPFNNTRKAIMRRLGHATRDLAKAGKMDQAYQLVREFSNPINRSQLYAFAAKKAIRIDGKYDYVDALIDSSLVETERIEATDSQFNRTLLAGALAFRNGPGDIDLAFKIIKNETLKAQGIWWISRGLAFNNDLYGSYDVIPDNLSDDDICGYLYEVFHDYNRNNRPESDYWSDFEIYNDLGDPRIEYIR